MGDPVEGEKLAAIRTICEAADRQSGPYRGVVMTSQLRWILDGRA